MENHEKTSVSVEHGSHGSAHSKAVHKPARKNELWDFIKRALIVVLVIVLIFIGSYAIIRVIPSLLSGLGSVSNSVSSIFKPKVTATASPTPSQAGTPTPTAVSGVTFLSPTPTPAYTTPIPTPTSAPVSPVHQSPAISNTNGRADLSARLLATGVIDRTTNQFRLTPTVNLSDKAAIRFEVINTGDKASGVWTFSASLPVDSSQRIYTSPAQRSLAPGDRIEFTMGFDGISPSGNQTLVISVDEGNTVRESNESNNVLTARFNIYNDGSYNGGNGGYYGNGGAPDLSVRFLRNGYVNSYGNFTTVALVGGSQRPAVQFQVTNLGGRSTGYFTWRATFPNSYNGYNSYNDGSQSNSEASLAPGASVIFTVSSDNYTNSGTQVTMQVDPFSQISESNESNNTAYGTLPGNYYNNNYSGSSYNSYDPYNNYNGNNYNNNSNNGCYYNGNNYVCY